jgi:hypothetical protein
VRDARGIEGAVNDGGVCPVRLPLDLGAVAEGHVRVGPGPGWKVVYIGAPGVLAEPVLGPDRRGTFPIHPGGAPWPLTRATREGVTRPVDPDVDAECEHLSAREIMERWPFVESTIESRVFFAKGREERATNTTGFDQAVRDQVRRGGSPPAQRRALWTALREVLNAHSAERGSNTPDVILADYLAACLHAFDEAVRVRATWHGPDFTPASAPPPSPSASTLQPVHPHERGVRAAKEGRLAGTNPYAPGSAHGPAWTAGWLDANARPGDDPRVLHGLATVLEHARALADSVPFGLGTWIVQQAARRTAR